MKRFVDFTTALILIIIMALPMALIVILIKLTSAGPAIYWSERVGKDNKNFNMPKFRTMRKESPEVATHLMQNVEIYLTPVGSFLRKTSLDELPQLWSVLKGDMSFVGPRPALFNQDDLIALRTKKNINQLIPGITGWAQINGRDDLPIPVKVEYDEYYLKNKSFFFDLKILWNTFFKVIKKEGVAH
ncbi:Lipid carrier : UDP-N-acetylgalactosaminyltransferase [Smithella sp. ME-1]|uniref:Lipid carrier: udp-n-acetylgalactosaminyltransferase n=1 Tax=hydrocarbon metagenome TaxID=938273 RepID=A0A0W8FV62_9ZZZZ|nr:Lipid carrier : UDP-N-acetylgalactosaminyltransferase [Smithella sp. ME-1]